MTDVDDKTPAVAPHGDHVPAVPEEPIANPGLDALKAVLNPPETDELFFVADGGGGHVFARTFDEHLRNVARWRQVEQERAAGLR